MQSNFIEITLRDGCSINLQSNFIEITLRHDCSPINLLHIFRAPFYKNTCGGLLLSGQKNELNFNSTNETIEITTFKQAVLKGDLLMNVKTLTASMLEMIKFKATYPLTPQCYNYVFIGKVSRDIAPDL